MHCRSTAFALSLIALVATSAGDVFAADARQFKPLDVFQLQWANNPEISPDGRSVVYERSYFDIMKDRKRSNLWIIDIASGNQRPLTSGSANDGQVAWSPDGKRLAYVSLEDGSAQIHMRWMDSGQSARITTLTEGPQGLSWSRDGKWLAYASRVPIEGKQLATMPAKPKGAEWADPVKLIDRLNYRFDGVGYIDPGYTQIFVVAADGGSPRQVTSGDYNYAENPAWTHDGKSLIVSSNRREDWEYHPFESELYRIDLDSGAFTQLTDRNGPDTHPLISPDGKQIAYLGFDDKHLGYQGNHLYLLDLSSGKSRVLTESFDFDIGNPSWDANGHGLFFSYDDKGVSKIGYANASDGKIETVASDFGGTAMGRPYAGGAMSAAAGKVAYTRGTEYRAADVAVIERGGTSRVLTNLNANLLDHKDLATVEELWTASSADSRPVEGWIVKPPHFDPAKKYPLLLEIHGGPYSNYGPRFAPEIQLYAAAGYVVLYSNPRGSTSYGQEFANLIQNAYPSKDYDDLMSLTDAVIAKGYVDNKNLFVTGGSGGGVLTAWIVGHTDRFRAAVVAKPVINWSSFALTTDLSSLIHTYWFAGYPWEHADNYAQRSPITYVGNVKTPTMLINGESDYRTPISEGEQFYQALTLRKVDTAMIRIPGASHEINRRPSNMLAQVLNTLAWFERYRGKD